MKKTKECLGSRNLFRADVENSLRIEDDIKCLSILFLPLLGVEAGGGRKSSWALSWKEESIRELCVCAEGKKLNYKSFTSFGYTAHSIASRCSIYNARPSANQSFLGDYIQDERRQLDTQVLPGTVQLQVFLLLLLLFLSPPHQLIVWRVCYMCAKEEGELFLLFFGDQSASS
jgi:hypothetical protein